MPEQVFTSQGVGPDLVTEQQKSQGSINQQQANNKNENKWNKNNSSEVYLWEVKEWNNLSTLENFTRQNFSNLKF